MVWSRAATQWSGERLEHDDPTLSCVGARPRERQSNCTRNHDRQRRCVELRVSRYTTSISFTNACSLSDVIEFCSCVHRNGSVPMECTDSPGDPLSWSDRFPPPESIQGLPKSYLQQQDLKYNFIDLRPIFWWPWAWPLTLIVFLCCSGRVSGCESVCAERVFVCGLCSRSCIRSRQAPARPTCCRHLQRIAAQRRLPASASLSRACAPATWRRWSGHRKYRFYG